MKIENVWPEWKTEKVIGQGAYGTVYKCVKDNDGTLEYSAIKVISIPRYDDEYEKASSESETNTQDDYREIVEDFVKEIKLLESLKGNKNIVSIEDSMVVEKETGIGWQIFIRMELLTSFSAYMANKKLETEDILKLGTDLCEALKVCKEKKIIHRDIKPENILVDSEGNFKLGDFGVAKQLEKTEMSLSRKGTYSYMAPEVFNLRKYDSRADIYSLGIVMYKLFNNNRLPFLDKNKQTVKYSEREEAFKKRINGEKIPAIDGVDSSINNLLLSACAFKVDERYRTVAEFENAINKIKSGKKLRKRLLKSATSKTYAVIVVALLIIAILSGIAVAAVKNTKKTDVSDKSSTESTSESTASTTTTTTEATEDEEETTTENSTTSETKSQKETSTESDTDEEISETESYEDEDYYDWEFYDEEYTDDTEYEDDYNYDDTEYEDDYTDDYENTDYFE